MINGFAPSQEGKALLLGNCHPAANCQWAVKVNTCPLSLRAACRLLIAIAGCCGLSHMWSLWGSAFWDQSEQRYIFISHTLHPVSFYYKTCTTVFWLQKAGYTCVQGLLGGPWVSSTCRHCCVSPLLVAWKKRSVSRHCRKSLDVSPRGREACGCLPKPFCKPAYSYSNREFGSRWTPNLFVSSSSTETDQLTFALYFCHVSVI